MSTKSLHELHLFIFFLAVIHVIYSASVMALGRLKVCTINKSIIMFDFYGNKLLFIVLTSDVLMQIRTWKEWEKETMSLNYEFSTGRFLSK